MRLSDRIRLVRDEKETARETLRRILPSDTKEDSFDDGEERVRKKKKSPKFYEKHIERKEQDILSLSGEARVSVFFGSLSRRRKKPKSRGPSSLPRTTSPFERNDGSKWPEGLSLRKKSGPRSASSGEEEGPATTPTDPYSYSPLPEASISQPGSVGLFNLRQGDSVKMLDHGSGAESFGTFVDSFTAYLAASMGMPIEVLLMRFSSNYSASRASLILFWRVANMYREQIDASLISPIYEQWLSEEISSGRRQCPGWSDPEVRSAWLSHRLVGDSAPTIDPVRSAQASLIDIQLGATTLERVARNNNGSPSRSKRRRFKRELDELVPLAAPYSSGKQGKRQKKKIPARRLNDLERGE